MSANALNYFFFKLMLGLCEQETPSFWISLMPFWNPSCPSWKSKFAHSQLAALISSANRLLCPVPFPGKWTPSSTGWIRPKRRWPRTSMWYVRNCGRSLLRQLLLLLALKKRRLRPGKERTASSVPDVRPEGFCIWWKYSVSLLLITY